MGLAVIGAPENSVNNAPWMGGSPVTGPKNLQNAHRGPDCGGQNKSIANEKPQAG